MRKNGFRYELTPDEISKLSNQIKGHFGDLIGLKENSFPVDWLERESAYLNCLVMYFDDFLQQAFIEGFNLCKFGFPENSDRKAEGKLK